MRGMLAFLVVLAPLTADAADRYVPPGGDLQATIDGARPGDVILLEPDRTYVGNFRLPNHGGTTHITIRSSAPDSRLPAAGTRISPDYAAYLPKIKSPNTQPAISTQPGAAFWRLQFLELQATERGFYDILALGDASEAQNTLASIPHDLIVDRVYIHGDRLNGQKRGIALNSANTTIANSYVSDIKAIGQDSQAIGGWNGPGPYVIENNYLEAAAEVILFGGAAPAIQGLVPSDIVIRGNTLTRPTSWRGPIVSSPVSVRSSISTGGTLTGGSYAYRVTARRPAYDTVAVSGPSQEVRVTVPSSGRVTLTWDAVPDATDYVVYGRVPGSPNMSWTVTSTTFTDDGRMTPRPGGPPSATVWQVKNLLEFKNGRRVLITDNLMENNWAQAQSGVAILFTPRAERGACAWCVVEDVTFEYNIVRGVGAGLNILGVDDETPSQQTNQIRIRHNEFSDVGDRWGGTGYFLLLLGGPRNVTVDHNTLISADGSGVLQVEGAAVQGFVFTNNLTRHNNYGIIGANRAPGLDTIGAFFPGATITRNVFAGAAGTQYPAGNEFPSYSDFEGHFVSYGSGNFALRPGTNWERAGTDGLDLGAIFPRGRVFTIGSAISAPSNVTIVQ